MTYLYYIYLIVICSILPIYMSTGYYALGEAKARCYLYVSTAFLLVFAIAFLIRLIKKDKIKLGKSVFLYGLLLTNLLTFVFAVDKAVAFWGVEGWRCGLAITVLEILFCIILSTSEGSIGYWGVPILLVPFGEFVLGIINRFGVYPFEIYGQNNSFIATLGNINWYSGFLSIFVPLGMGILYVSKPFSPAFFLSGIYTIAGFMAILVQGSNGAGLILIASFVALGVFAVFSEDRHNLKKLIVLLGNLGFAMMIVNMLVVLKVGNYTYEENFLTNLCKMHIGAVVTAFALFAYSFTGFLDAKKVPYKTKLAKRLLVGACVIAFGCSIWLIMRNFSDDFGNGRGIIWRMSADIFLSLSPWQKIVGVGQDCFYNYAMKDPMWSMSFYNIFGDEMLTNAHCEVLTVLIEKGMLGAVFFVGLFVSVICKLLKANKKEPTAVIYALPVISYLIFGLVSFSQVTSTPYVYLCIGLALGKLRNLD